MSRLPDPVVKGIAVLDESWVPGRIHEADTTLTEADPQPGTAATVAEYARLVPQLLGVQSRAGRLVVTQSGNPGLGQPRAVLTESSSLDAELGDIRKAEVGYYLDDGLETQDNLRGLVPATRITDWRSPGTIAQPDRADASVFSLSGKVALQWNAALDVRFAVWDPYSDSFENFGSLSAAQDDVAALVCVPGTERLLRLGSSNSSFTDDYGANWSLYSHRGPFSVRPDELGTTYAGKVRAAFDGADNVIWVATNTNNGNLHVYGSSDLGTTWTFVESWSADPDDWDLSAHPDGSLYLAYIDASSHVLVARLSGAYGKPSEAEGVHVFGDAHSATEFEASRVWLAIDWNGAMWCYAEEAANPGRWRVAVSTDGGTKWNEQLHDISGDTPYFWNLSNSVEGPGGWRLVPNAAGGLVAAACFGQIGTGREQGGLAKLGGWTSPQSPALVYGHLEGGRIDRHWVGYAKPEDVAGTYWTFTGTATTTHSSGDGSPITPLGYVKIDSGAGALTGYYEATLTTEGAYTVLGEFAVQVQEDAGQDQVIGVRWQMDSIADDHSATVALYLTETGWRLRNLVAASWFGAQVNFDLTDRTWFSIIISPATDQIDILYRHDGETKWNRQTYSTAFAGTTVSTDTVEVKWGHQTSGAANAVSRWWVSQHGATIPGGDITPPESGDEHLTGLDVRSVSAGREHPYPLPELHDTSAERMCMLALGGGVGVRGEEYVHDVAPGYPREALFPGIEPSTSRRWRSESVGVSQSLAVDRGYDSRPNAEHTVLWLVAGANARRWRVSYKEDGGGSYTTIGTVDLAVGFESVGFTRYGNLVLPGVGTAGARYVHDGELVGGHMVLGVGGSPVAYRIKSNVGGFWDANATGPRAVIELEDVDTGTAPSSGTARIVWPTGVFVDHGDGSSGSFRRYWRVTCLDENLSPDTYYEAGLVAPFGLKVPGKQWGNGWEWSHEPNVRSSEDSFGTERRDQKGPERRILTLNWDHGFKMGRLRGKTDADYIGAAGKAALAARDEVWQRLVDTWRVAKGGSLPCLALLTDPGHGVTLTDPTLFLLCYLDGALRAQHATGLENVSEFMRAGPVRLKGIV